MLHTLTIDFGNGARVGTGTPVRILGHDGLVSLPTAANVVEHALLDGGYVAASRSATRRLTFELDFGHTRRWSELGRLFPSGATFPMTVTRDGVTRRVVAVRDVPLVPLGGQGVADPVAVQVSLVCPNPYLLGEEVVLPSMVTVTGGLEYPAQFAPTLEYEEIDTSATVWEFDSSNPGDHPVGFVFDYVSALTGSPSIEINGAVMQFGEVAAGERLRVDTGRKTITLDGANAFSLLASGRFLPIPAGDFTLLMDDVIGSATVSFTPVYEGV